MASTSTDLTLMSFNAIDLRSVNVGDVVRFRSTSITHSQALPLRHGRTARVVGFSKTRSGQPQVDVQFATDALLGDDESVKLTSIVGLAPRNLIANNEQSAAAAVPARKAISTIVAACAEAGRPWMARIKVQAVLGDQGMYDSLGQPTPTHSADLADLPF